MLQYRISFQKYFFSNNSTKIAMKIILMVLIYMFISLDGFTQNKSRKLNFIEGELYIKLKQMKTFTKVNAQVNVKEELSFLDKVSSEIKILAARKPFFSSNSSELQKIYRIKVNTKDIESYIKLLQVQPDVDYVERIEVIKLESVPNDSYVSFQNSLKQIKAFEAWESRSPVRGIKIAVVDNAVQTTHRDLEANMLPGYDVSDDDNDPNPPNDTFKHGTHVAGIAGAVTNNSRGIASASNNSVKIIPIKVASEINGPNVIDSGYEGIVWAADNGANIINCSWGRGVPTNIGNEAIKYALSKGCIIVVSAGNNDLSYCMYPACYEGVVSVANIDGEDVKSSFSNYGSWIDIAAPGNSILSTIPTNKYTYLSGTSMSAPLIAAYLGYLWACFPELSREKLISLMECTADDISLVNPNYIGMLGAGRVNLLNAINCNSLGYQTIAVTSKNTPFICKGQTVLLEATNMTEGMYQWYKNDTLLIGEGEKFTATEEGLYKVRFMKDGCSLTSKSMKVGVTTLKSPTPIVNNIITTYCSPTDNGLFANVVSCNSGTQTFTYHGEKVGYDNYYSSLDSNEYRTIDVNVSGMSGYITKISVTVNWEKKNQTNINSCDLEDLGGNPHYEEVGFILSSPSSKEFYLKEAPQDAYLSVNKSIGSITSTFEDGAPYENYYSESQPLNGTFAPRDLLSGNINDNPNGIWSLIPFDTAEGNPLCVSGFSITITTNIPNQNSTTSWFDSQGGLIKQGNELLLSNQSIGTQKFIVSNQCEGFCPSDDIQVEYIVKPVPEISIFPITETIINQLNSSSILANTNLNYKKDNFGNTIIYCETDKGLKEVSIGNVPPLTNPVTICSTNDSYLMLANGCPTNIITWSNGQNGQGFIVKPSSTTGYSAYCNQNWNMCTPIISNIVHFISIDHHPYPIVDEIKANNVQKFVQNNIIASNKINTPAKIDYRGMKSIELKPGFQVQGNSVFKADIKGCDN